MIGSQASGKSVIAKLLYYFKSFLFEIINTAKQSKTEKDLNKNYIQRAEVRVIKIDGCVIKKGKRCDYLVILSSGEELYIELKGSKVSYAVEQILASIPELTADKSKEKLGFICSTRCPINSTETQKLKKNVKKKYNLKLTIKNGEIVYKI